MAEAFGVTITHIGGISVMLTVGNLSAVRHLPHTSDGDIVAEAFITADYNVENGQRIDGGGIKPPIGSGPRIAQNLGHFDAAVLSLG